MNGGGRALMEPHPDNKILVQYPRCLDLRAMGEDRAALGWIATAANIWDMELLEVADKHVSLTAWFGIRKAISKYKIRLKSLNVLLRRSYPFMFCEAHAICTLHVLKNITIVSAALKN